MRLKSLGVIFAVVFALSAIAASAASAANPEFLPGSGGFTATSGAGELQIEGGGTVKCASDEVKKGNGTITGPKTFTATVDFSKCKALGFPANSKGDPAETILVSIKGTLCYLNAAAKEVGAEVAIVGAPLVLEVPTAKATIEVSGTAIAKVEPVNKKQTEGKLVFTQKEGKQTLTKCEGGAATNYTALENGKGPKNAGESTTETITFEAATELMA